MEGNNDDKLRWQPILFVAIFLIFSLMPCAAAKRGQRGLIRRVHTYAVTLDTSGVSRTDYSYSRATLHVVKRNSILMTVPSAYVIARSKARNFITETYQQIVTRKHDDFSVTPVLRLTSVDRNKRQLDVLDRFLTPTIYDETIVGNSLLSPFYPSNRRFYSYSVDVINGNRVHLRFQPKRVNTQLVSGTAVINQYTGRIISCNINGEYDHISFLISMDMGEHGFTSLYPKKCDASFLFTFVGNKIVGHYTSYYGLPKMLPDSLPADAATETLMAMVRPDSLVDSEKAIYQLAVDRRRNDSIAAAADTTHHRKHWAKRVLWDAVGDNVLNRVKTHFGLNNKGYIRLNPIINPLYMGYDHRRGFIWKTDLHISYQLNDNSEINARFRGGYAFKQRQFYFRLPIYYYFNRRRNGYIKAEMGNGNHIMSNSVRQAMNLTPADTLGMHFILDELNEFRHLDTRLVVNYDLSRYFSVQVGVLFQKMEAVNKRIFQAMDWADVYKSFAPVFELQYRPWGWSGPVFSVDYDRSIKGVMKSNIEYERMEMNGEYIHQINRLQSLQMRAGAGFYTMRGRKAFFLNYENFQDNNLVGGWNDDWSGEFELLRSDTYNTSDYYVRANLTYESPLLLLSWLPLIGRYIEMGRIYASILDTRNVHPYIELGYGFTTRLFSMGIFTSSGQGNRAFGCKFGFELFRHW